MPADSMIAACSSGETRQAPFEGQLQGQGYVASGWMGSPVRRSFDELFAMSGHSNPNVMLEGRLQSPNLAIRSRVI